MQTNKTSHFNLTLDSDFCKKCGNQLIEADHPYMLCKNCHERLNSGSISLGIKFMILIIILGLIYSLSTFYTPLKTAMAYKGAKEAASENKYVTALAGYTQIENIYPDSPFLQEDLAIAYFQNGQMQKSYDYVNELLGPYWLGKEEYSKELYRIRREMWRLYLPSEKFYRLLIELDAEHARPDYLLPYVQRYVEEYSILEKNSSFYLAKLYYELEEYEQAIALIQDIFDQYPDFNIGRLLLAQIYKDMGNYERASFYCNRVLTANQESGLAYAIMAQMELLNRKDLRGLELAEIAFSYSAYEPEVQRTLILAYHYNGMISKRDQLLEDYPLLKDAKNEELLGILSGRIDWR